MDVTMSLIGCMYVYKTIWILFVHLDLNRISHFPRSKYVPLEVYTLGLGLVKIIDLDRFVLIRGHFRLYRFKTVESILRILENDVFHNR